MRALLFLLLLAGSAHAAPRLYLVGGTGETARDGPIEARRGETVRLFVAVRDGRTWYSDAPTLRIGRRTIPAKRVRPFVDFGADAVHWFKVEPHPHHLTTPPPNAGNPAYSNSVLFGAKHGKWLGYDTLEYFETPLGEGASSLTVDQVQPAYRRLQTIAKGLGTLRFKAVVVRGEQVLATPGKEATGRGGISPEVTRVSVRAGDDLVGWLTSFFNVPNVFGSAGKGRRHQTDRHQGADCADVIVGALRKGGARVPYTSVSGLHRIARPVTAKLYLDETGVYALNDDGAREPIELDYGTDVRRGDVMLIDYAGFQASPRSWDHVGVVGDDAGAPGLFDAGDALFHMGYLVGLVEEPAATQTPAFVQFLRVRRKHLPR